MENVKLYATYHNERPELPQSIATTQVLILTYYRSGSSFFSQIFNQHPDAFFNFEPIFPFGRDCTSNIAYKVATLKSLLSCDYTSVDWTHNFESYKFKSMDKLQFNDRACIAHNSCFRFNTKSFCSEELCPQPLGVKDRIRCPYCGKMNLFKASSECAKKKVHAIKTIRICDSAWLENIILEVPNLKIIHLVRDPRGLAASRLKLHKNLPVLKNITAECDNQLNTHTHVQRTKSNQVKTFLEKNLLEVRYEDMARDPIKITKEVFDFVGLDYSIDMDKYLRNVHGAKDNLDESIEIVSNRDSMLRQKRFVNPFGTVRKNSSAVSESWRQYLKTEVIEKIEHSMCGKMIDEYGYDRVL